MRLCLLKKMYISTALLILIQGVGLASAQAGDEAREQHRFGIYGSLLGDPYLSLLGANLAYNLTSFMRLTASYGSFSVDLSGGANTATMSVTSMGGGLKLFLPNSSFSPTVGVGYSTATVTLTGTDTASTGLSYGLGASGQILTASFGIDWQTHYGLDFGIGYNLPLTTGLTGLPYLTLGWFF